MSDVARAESVPTLIRLYRESDQDFVYSTWLKHYRMSSVARWVPGGIYFHEQGKLIGRLLGRGRCYVACSVADEDQIHGWVCVTQEGEFRALHYGFVKEVYRGFGIFDRLWEEIELEGPVRFYTHLPPVVSDWIRGILRKRGCIFDPYLLTR